MPRHATIALTPLAWNALTVNNVSAVRVTNLGQEAILLQATVGLTPPANNAAGLSGGVPLGPGETLAADLTLAQLFPGVAGANNVYAYAYSAGNASVSHA